MLGFEQTSQLRQLQRELGHVPIVVINSRGRQNPPTLDQAQKKRFAERTVVERINSRLKDSFGCADSSVDALMRLMLYQERQEEPSPLAC